MVSGIHHFQISETPIAILDVETTGMNAGSDRIVELSVVRIDPHSEPKLVLDTLINPSRRMGATEIHGIADEDVVNAPHFSEVVDALQYAISGCVVGAYNVYFDMRFIDYELRNCGVPNSLPHFCLMYMRPLLGLGPRCCLSDACTHHNIPYSNAHMASADAMASAGLMKYYFNAMLERNIETFHDLTSRKDYKFFNSFDLNPTTFSKDTNSFHKIHLHSRNPSKPSIAFTQTNSISSESKNNEGLIRYWDAIKAAIADIHITEDELQQLKNIESTYGLTDSQIRFVHARVYSAVINQFIEDRELDERERLKLKKLHNCLSYLGWAPGE